MIKIIIKFLSGLMIFLTVIYGALIWFKMTDSTWLTYSKWQYQGTVEHREYCPERYQFKRSDFALRGQTWTLRYRLWNKIVLTISPPQTPVVCVYEQRGQQ